MKCLVLGDGILATEFIKKRGWDYLSRKKDGLNAADDFFYWSCEIMKGDYDIIINCIANTDTYSEDRDGMLKVNYDFVVNLHDFCVSMGIKLVHISTEYVYANNTKLPTENDLPLISNNWYTYSKLLADEYIMLDKNKNYLICRCTHKKNDFSYKKIWNVKTSGDTVDKISDIILKLIDNNANGLYNVGTGTKFLYEIAINDDYEIIDAPNNVPVDTRMDLSKLKKELNEL